MEHRPWFAHWPVGLPHSLDYPQTPITAFLDSAAKRYPDNVAAVFLGAEHSYAKVHGEALAFAGALQSLGVEKGDVVGVHLPNCWQFLVVYYGLLYAGATFSPVSPLLAAPEIERQLADCNAKVFVTLDLFWPHISEAVSRSPVKEVVLTSVAEAQPGGEPLDAATLGQARSFKRLLDAAPITRAVEVDVVRDLAHIAYTGGTTGTPKGVMLSHFNVVTNALQYAHWGSSGRPVWTGEHFEVADRYESPSGEWEYAGEEGTDSLVVVVPWFHAMGTVGYLNVRVYAANKMILHPRFDPAGFIADCASTPFIGGAPALFVTLLNDPSFDKQDWNHVKLIASGAAPLAVELLERLNKMFPQAVVMEAYGMSECTMGATANPANRSGLRKIGTVGIPVFDTEIKVVDLETGDREVAVGEEGEVCIRGPQVMRGYLNKPHETAQVLRNGWLYSGDIGKFDDDGYLSIVDRKKDMLIYKGYNVYPRELEEVLFAHPAVANAAVVGQQTDVGELPIAVVIRKPGEGITEEQLAEWVNGQVAAYKKLRRVVFTDQIPVSEAGKVLKRVLRSQLSELGI